MSGVSPIKAAFISYAEQKAKLMLNKNTDRIFFMLSFLYLYLLLVTIKVAATVPGVH